MGLKKSPTIFPTIAQKPHPANLKLDNLASQPHKTQGEKCGLLGGMFQS
jgi:hypothetical protein